MPHPAVCWSVSNIVQQLMLKDNIAAHLPFPLPFLGLFSAAGSLFASCLLPRGIVPPREGWEGSLGAHVSVESQLNSAAHLPFPLPFLGLFSAAGSLFASCLLPRGIVPPREGWEGSLGAHISVESQLNSAAHLPFPLPFLGLFSAASCQKSQAKQLEGHDSVSGSSWF